MQNIPEWNAHKGQIDSFPIRARREMKHSPPPH